MIDPTGKYSRKFPGVVSADGRVAKAKIGDGAGYVYKTKSLPGKPATKMLIEQVIVDYASVYDPETMRVTIEKRL